MNEAAQVLKQTNHERKVAGYGIHHKKGRIGRFETWE